MSEHREERQKEAKTTQEQRLDDLRQILKTPHGRRYLKGMLAFHLVFQDIPTTNNAETYKAIGKRQAGLRIYAEIFQADMRLAFELFGENLNRNKT